MSRCVWVLPRGLLQTLQDEKTNTKNGDLVSWRQRCHARLSGSDLLHLFEEMQPTPAFPGDSGPTAWPLPPRINSKGKREFEFRKVSPVQSGDDTVLEQHRVEGASSSKSTTTQAVKGVFEQISDLYPQEPKPHSQANELQDGKSPDNRPVIDTHDNETTERKHISNASLVQLGKLFEDDSCGIRSDVGYDDMEPMIDRGKRLSEQVDLGPSLIELFSDDGDFMTPKTSMKEEPNAEEEILSFSFGGENSKESSFHVREALRELAKSKSKSYEGKPLVVNGVNDVHLQTSLQLKGDERTSTPEGITPVARRVLGVDPKKASIFSKPQEQAFGSPSPHAAHSGGSPLSSEPVAKRALRRPMASRRTRMVDIPELKKEFLAADGGQPGMNLGLSSVFSPKGVGPTGHELGYLGTPNRRGRTPKKGVIMRTVSQHRKIAGNRLAETGMIMSREEMQNTADQDIDKNPAPKSLRPLELETEDDEGMENVPTLTAGTLELLDSKTEEGAKSKEKRSLFSLSSARWSARSGGFFHREEKESSSRFSEMGESSGLMTRLSSGLKRAGMLFGRKGMTEFGGREDILVTGTLDEAVCRICMVCRKKLGYRVYVRDGGRKIRVEGMEQGKGGEVVRATLVIAEMGGTDPMCGIVVHTSRTEGKRTSVAALSRFFQRLETELID